MARKKRTSTVLHPKDWEDLPDEQLLQIRVRDFGLRIEGSWLEPRIAQLHEELDARGIHCHPPCYLADEWLCPNKVPLIGIPFYLAHPRLKQLEKKMMLEVEGETEPWCMKLLRHEAGHALNYAYRFFRRTRWRELFGPFSAPYRDSYTPRPYSKRYVIHLEDNYAQAHPDEDFSETFAVCLTPGSNWRDRYRDWPAMKKLRYVDGLIEELGSKAPVVTTREELAAAARMTSTLAMYYDRRRRSLRDAFPGFYDPALQRLFTGDEASGLPKAADFLRRWRRQIVDGVCMWTGDRKFEVNALVNLLIKRSRALKLYQGKGDVETAYEVAGFVTAAMKRVHTFLEKRAKST